MKKLQLNPGLVCPALIVLFAVGAAQGSVLYVDPNSPSPRSPYNTWAKAARTIQDAIDAASSGDQVLVTNGVFQTGGRPAPGGTLTNRVVVDKPLTLQSMNGPAVTIIAGYQAPATTNGPAAVRCVYLTSGAVLTGFTLTNGATASAGNLSIDGSGAGVWCASASATVSNCVITGNAAVSGAGGCGGTFWNSTFLNNAAFDSGGGALQATLNNCLLSGNSAITNGGGSHYGSLYNCALTANSAGVSGGGVDLAVLVQCVLTNNLGLYGGGANNSTAIQCGLSNNSAFYGGGVYGGQVSKCILMGNSARDGAGAFGGLLYNCLLAGNSASNTGGGMWIGTMNNCTVVSNSASGEGGGAYYCDLTNCIVYDNAAPAGPNHSSFTDLVNYCCTTPAPPGGQGSFTNAPLFVDESAGNFRLQPRSPCVNGGNNDYATGGTDLDGNPRIVAGAVDVGAFELSTPQPVAYTLPVTAIGSNQATLNGFAVANGLPTLAWFEWGDLTGFGQHTPPVSAGSSSNVAPVTVTVSNLLPTRHYQCRLVMSNAGGIFRGATRLFATGARIKAWGYDGSGQTTVPGPFNNIAAVAGGGYFSAALKTDGSVLVWGDNTYGQANVPPSLSNVSAVACGEAHCLAIKSDGTVAAWGDNSYGATSVPPGLSNVVAISAGGNHSLALKADGTIAAWGRNSDGQTTVPAGLSNLVGVAGGRYHTLVLKADGTMLAWGRTNENQTLTPAIGKVAAATAGGYHNLGLKVDGTVAGAGENEFNQTVAPAGLGSVLSLVAGLFHNVALTADRTVTAWWYNNYGESAVPTGLSNVVAVAAGFDHSLALASNSPPQAFPVNLVGLANQDLLLIQFAGSDADGDAIHFRVSSLPVAGALYQYVNGTRGALITAPNTDLTDNAGRVIFAPPVGATGNPTFTFSYVANDGMDDSVAATVTMNIITDKAFATTQSAIAVTRTSATLGGMVVPNQLLTSAWFEWGERGSYTQTTAPVSVGSGTVVVRVSAAIANLAASKSYQFRLAASNSLGVIYGAPQFFATGFRLRVWGDDSYGQTDLPSGLSNIVAVSAGSEFNAALRADATVAAWGWNGRGQTNLPSGLTNVVAIASGFYQTLALKSDGTVLAWGSFWDRSTATPVYVPAGLNNIVALAAGRSHSVALGANGRVTVWGVNNFGQTNVPAGLSNVVAIAAGAEFTLASKSDGTVVAWGFGDYGQTTVPAGLSNVVACTGTFYDAWALSADGTLTPWGDNLYNHWNINYPVGITDFVAISAGGLHMLALRAGGTVAAWGYDTSSLGIASVPAGISNVVAIGAGDSHNIMLLPNTPPVALPQVVTSPVNQDVVITLAANDIDGDLLSFRIASLPSTGALYQYVAGGRGAAILSAQTPITDPLYRVVFAPAQGGVGAPYTSFQFAASDGEADSPAANVIVNLQAPLFVFTQPATQITTRSAKLNGMLAPSGFMATGWFEWGISTAYGPRTSSSDFSATIGVAHIEAPLSGLTNGQVIHFRLVASNISQVVYGADQQFILGGRANAWGDNSSGQIQIPANLGKVAALAGGLSHSLALHRDGSMAAWGNNTYGQTNVPPAVTNAGSIAAGGFHNLALLKNGTVLAWGRNNLGQANVPPALSNVVAVAAGGSHSLALRGDGTLAGWGDNSEGQVTLSPGLTNAVQIAAGWYHSLALRSDGTVAAWGNNTYGQRNVPVGLTNVVWLAAGLYDSLALRGDGTVVAWGYNGQGQINVPSNLTTVVSIAGGGWHNLALGSDESLIGWGYNSYGQTVAPAALSNIVTIAAGGTHSLAITTASNAPPIALDHIASGYVNHDLLVTLQGNDPDGDALTFKIVSPPAKGALFQCASGLRGPPILLPEAPVTDAAGRVIFAPGTNEVGMGYAATQFRADDGLAVSAAATVTFNVLLPAPPQILSATSRWNNGAFQFNFLGTTTANYGVWASTNLKDWSFLGPAQETDPGLYQFIDTPPPNSPWRFYRCQAP